jgi:hypothetical protein
MRSLFSDIPACVTVTLLDTLADIEDPPLIAKILGQVQWRQVSTGSAARAPPRGPPADSHQTLMLT